MYACMYVYVRMYVYMCVCMYYVCICACMCMHACMYVCMYVCVYVCMCVHVSCFLVDQGERASTEDEGREVGGAESSSRGETQESHGEGTGRPQEESKSTSC